MAFYPARRPGRRQFGEKAQAFCFLDPFFTTVVQTPAGHGGTKPTSSYLAFASRSRRPKSMSQIFRQSATILSKVSIFGVLSLVGGLVLLAIVLPRSTYVTRQHEFIEQPLQFSHINHVADALTRQRLFSRADTRELPRQSSAAVDPHARSAGLRLLQPLRSHGINPSLDCSTCHR